MLCRRFAPLLPILLAVSFETPTAAQAPPPASERDRYGVNDDYMAPLAPATLAAARQAGFGWVNYTLYWNLVNPSNGEYHWDDPDLAIQRIVDAGLVPYIRVRYPPTWATGDSYPNAQVPFYCPNEVTTKPASQIDPQCACKAVAAGVQGAVCSDPNWRTHVPSAADFTAFVNAAVNRYKDRVRFWGFGEEVHNPFLWAGTTEDFVTHVLRPGYVAVKAMDPSLTVVGPDEDWADWVDGLLRYEAAYGRWADILSFHLLRQTGGAIDKLDDPLASEHFLIKPILDRLGQGRPFWLTELGAPSPIPGRFPPETEGDRAGWFTTQFDGVVRRPWIDKVFVYRLYQPVADSGDFGILNPDNSPTLSFSAIQAFLSTQSTPRVSYLAEGALGIFEMDVCLANPNATSAPVKVTFLKEDGTVLVLPKVLPPQSRDTIHVKDVPGAAGSLSTAVESTSGLPVVVERTMLWSNREGGHTGSAVDGARSRWYFAEGAQGIFDTFVLLANDNIVPAAVDVTFLREGLSPVVTHTTVRAKSRATIWTATIPDLVNQAFSIQVDSAQPIIAERAMYFGGPLGSWKGGHESAGVGALSDVWYHAEGATGSEFDTWLLVGNPNDTDADLRITFYRDSGGPIEFPTTVRAQQRLTLHVDDLKSLGSTTFSIKVESLNGVPVVSERAMYWPGDFATWEEAHNSLGVTQPGTKWGLAEGRIGGVDQFETYILLANPNPTDATVHATFLRKTGPPLSATYTVRASSRFTIAATFKPWGNVPPALGDEEFGTVIESVGGEPLVVEQAIYWSAVRNGQLIPRAGGSNVAATPLP